MRRRIKITALFLAACGLFAAPRLAQAQADQQALIDNATRTIDELSTLGDNTADFTNVLRRARAAVICPSVIRAGFIFAGQGGACVLVARDGSGSWSSPAFYGLGSGSFGAQAGVQEAQIAMLIMSQRGLDAVLNSQFTIGADAAIAIANMGSGIGGATTAAVGADIVAFARSRGLFAGIALEGSLLSTRPAANRAYYGRDVAARQVVIDMAAHNPGADPLRVVLMRHGPPNS
ncbi:lipid-binding SYLF domain-containing protein [Humitalea sp. 24SJ18S-53]|uniref:lipid-binding SYLF domain-containing protein n=1 Tax=Humitalea sp. 24SJ18S-53 TaxID=3422307 RepID=UPI003D66A169